ncbi:MAG: Pyruvate carboxylase subunit A [Methanonatronarchaeales archaeon]|nr:Pyruvate carboxylase subunit A [Methanonatronarchaeales archaeon]
MFDKVLVANRGEIAVRIMRALRELEVSSVAVYSEADRRAFFAKYADEAYELGPSPPSQSYLNIDRIIGVANLSGVDAVHPGYGFLAENARFVERCEREGITFIGPSSQAIADMGDKARARELMDDAGVPVTPGTDAAGDDDLIDAANDIGYPVIVKPSAGGGGIGMQVVERREEMAEAIKTARSTARSAFGDDAVYVEKYLQDPRHIEIQVLADGDETAHLGERECSIQRRHQKVLEEAPSPIVDEEMREEMGAAGIAAAEAVDYENAGTVEFLYSGGEFYFAEMNTRLQVEHPVTEFVTGIDIVKEQVRVATGESLSFAQNDVEMRGHAIECRINAEDPLNDFAPTPARIEHYRSPGSVGVRVDSGVHMGYTIPSTYDSMISKLIVWGRDREEATSRMRRALFDYVIGGVTTNIPFHKALMKSPDFVEGRLSTNFIENHPELFDEVSAIQEKERDLSEIFDDRKSRAAVAAAIHHRDSSG